MALDSSECISLETSGVVPVHGLQGSVDIHQRVIRTPPTCYAWLLGHAFECDIYWCGAWKLARRLNVFKRSHGSASALKRFLAECGYEI